MKQAINQRIHDLRLRISEDQKTLDDVLADREDGEEFVFLSNEDQLIRFTQQGHTVTVAMAVAFLEDRVDQILANTDEVRKLGVPFIGADNYIKAAQEIRDFFKEDE